MRDKTMTQVVCPRGFLARATTDAGSRERVNFRSGCLWLLKGNHFGFHFRAPAQIIRAKARGRNARHSSACVDMSLHAPDDVRFGSLVQFQRRGRSTPHTPLHIPTPPPSTATAPRAPADGGENQGSVDDVDPAPRLLEFRTRRRRRFILSPSLRARCSPRPTEERRAERRSSSLGIRVACPRSRAIRTLPIRTRHAASQLRASTSSKIGMQAANASVDARCPRCVISALLSPRSSTFLCFSSLGGRNTL